MNEFVTPAALTEFKALLRRTAGVGISIEALPRGGTEVTVLFSLDEKRAIMLNAMPPIFTTLKTLKQLQSAAIDYDFRSHEFIIRLERDVVYSNAG